MRTSWAVSLLLASAALGNCAGPGALKTFRSRRFGYTASYPASWYLEHRAVRLDSLDIFDFPPSRRVKGVILPEDGAEIEVGPAPPEIHTVPEWIGRNTKLDTAVERRELKDLPSSPNGCTTLTEVTSLNQLEERSRINVTNYYCSTGRGLYMVSLTNWEGNPRLEALRKVALEIALSLRTF